MRTIEEIKAELREAEAAESAKAQALRDSVKPEWVFTLTPSESKWHEVYDDTCLVYRLEGRVTNLEALKAVGSHMPALGSGGAMDYVFNTVTGKLIMAVGGGTIYINRQFGKRSDGSDVTAMNELGAFLVAHPDGGDITSIVVTHQQRRGSDD